MRKKVLSLLTAACLTLSLAPAAFAADTGGEWYTVPENAPTAITRPDGEMVEIKDFAPAAVPTSSIDNPVEIGSVDEFMEQEWLSGGYYKLTADLDFSDISQPQDAWTAVISGFYAHLDGDGHTISGIWSDKYLFDNCVGGTIENLTFDVGNEAAFLMFGPATMAGAYTDLTMRNIDVVGSVQLTSANQSNYSPFIYAAHGNFTMEDCTNYADITGVTYASVFYGYSTVMGGKTTFRNCVNHGDVNLTYGALFFGNPAYLTDAYTSEHNVSVDIIGCHNYGTIRSLSTEPHYFVTDVGGGLSNFSQAMEAKLTAEENNTALTLGGICTDDLCTNKDKTHDGKLYHGTAPEGLTLSLGEDQSLIVTRATNEQEAGIAYYEVAVSSYVNVYTKQNGKLVKRGTEQRSVSELLFTDEDTGNTITSNVKYYGFADAGIGAYQTNIEGWDVVQVNGQNYYEIGEEEAGSITYPGDKVYVSDNSVVSGEFVGSAAPAQKAAVFAYGDNDELIACVYLGGK